MIKLIEVEPRGGYQLALRFSDGAAGVPCALEACLPRRMAGCLRHRAVVRPDGAAAKSGVRRTPAGIGPSWLKRGPWWRAQWPGVPVNPVERPCTLQTFADDPR